MNDKHRAIRALLSTMAPLRAIGYVQSFSLPPEEELFVIECDIRGKSYVQAAREYATTPEVIKRRRQRAYSKISDALEHEKSRG